MKRSQRTAMVAALAPLATIARQLDAPGNPVMHDATVLHAWVRKAADGAPVHVELTMGHLRAAARALDAVDLVSAARPAPASEEYTSCDADADGDPSLAHELRRRGR